MPTLRPPRTPRAPRRTRRRAGAGAPRSSAIARPAAARLAAARPAAAREAFARAAALPFCGALALAALLAAPRPALAGDPFLRRTATVEVVRKVGPSVVNITTERQVRGQGAFRPFGDPFFDRFFQDFFEPRVPQTVQSLGSGVIIDERRHVLTNQHVIDRATRVRVTLADGREFDARLVGADPNNDLAVLRIETDEKLPWTPPGDSGDVLVGEPVIAIGNPFGLSNTVTTGVISALDRSVRANERVFHGFLQTDASINPGNSGGPLLNAEGSLIGINTAIYGNAQGIGFAIPIDVAERVVAQLISTGRVEPVSIGLEVQEVDERISEALELPRGTTGALVSRVEPDGPGARAGVERGELVTQVNGSSVRSARDFYEILESATPGSEVKLGLWRDGRRETVTLRAQALSKAEVDALAERLLGLRLRAAPRGGFVVEAVRPNSGAARIGFQPGDLVLGINGREIGDEAALRRAVLDLRGRPQALLVVQRAAGRYHVAVPLA